MGIDIHEMRRKTLSQPKQPAKPAIQVPQVPDGQKDIYECVRLTLQALASACASEAEAKGNLSEANLYLRDHLLTYLAMLRKRNLTSCYEFLTPPGASANPALAGWYWRHPKHNPRDSINWKGPFASRKAAIEARMRNGPASKLELLEADIF